MYGVISSKTRKIKKLYGAIGSTTRNIKKVYGVVGGVTRLIYSSSIEISYPFYFAKYTNTCNINDYLQNGTSIYPVSVSSQLCSNCGSYYTASGWSFNSTSNMLFIKYSDHYYNTVNTTGQYYLECDEGYGRSAVYFELPKINGNYDYLIGHKIYLDPRNNDGTPYTSMQIIDIVGATATYSTMSHIQVLTISSITFDTVKIKCGGRYVNVNIYSLYLDN